MSNTINALVPQLTNPGLLNYRPALGGNVFSVTTYAVPDFAWEAFTPAVPAGTLTNTVNLDRDGNARVSAGPPGAYAVGAVDTAGHLYLPLVRR